MGKIKLGLSAAILAALLGFIALNMNNVEVNLMVKKLTLPVGFIAIGSSAAGALLTLLLLVFKSSKK